MLAVPEPNFTDGLAMQAGLRPDGVAVHLPDGVMSYRHLDGLVWRIATLLHDRGVRAGDVVAQTFSTELVALVTLLATARIGATVFSIPGNYPALQKADMMARAGVTVIASDREAGHPADLPVIRIDRRVITDRALRVDPAVRDAAPAAPWLIIAGSGSTGAPKLIPLSHRVFLQRVVLFGKGIHLGASDCVASLINIDFQ